MFVVVVVVLLSSFIIAPAVTAVHQNEEYAERRDIFEMPAGFAVFEMPADIFFMYQKSTRFYVETKTRPVF